MPWHAQVCPFCQINYANKAGLHNHLKKYVGELRLPNDGVHDVLKIQKILFPEPGGDNAKQYKCPQCSTVITGKYQFINHVVYRVHYGEYYDTLIQDMEAQRHTRGRTQRGSWILPFDESVALIPKRKGVFKFLNLPYELRQIIYEYALIFQRIEFQKEMSITLVEETKNGIWLQRNPPRNPLALLSVNRQVYDEARRVFYSRNHFVFNSMKIIPPFLVGIGRENTQLLRTVEAENYHQFGNQVDLIRASATTSYDCGTIRDIWNSVQGYGNFMDRFLPGTKIDASYAERLIRPNADHLTNIDHRRRYCFSVKYVYNDEGLGKIETLQVGTGTASYELYGAARV